MHLAQNSANPLNKTYIEPFEEKMGVQIVHFNDKNEIESSETRPLDVYLGAFEETCKQYLESKKFISKFTVLD